MKGKTERELAARLEKEGKLKAAKSAWKIAAGLSLGVERDWCWTRYKSCENRMVRGWVHT